MQGQSASVARGQGRKRHNRVPGGKVGPKASAVSEIARNEGAPLRYRLRNANPATISYGAAQGQRTAACATRPEKGDKSAS